MRELLAVSLFAAWIAVVLGTVMAGPCPAQVRPGGRYPWSTRSMAVGHHGMAATSQPLATQAAVEVLRRGGSAVDAAIAANAVLTVTEPTGCGLGGDLFAMVWWQEDRALHGYNGSGRSPRGLTLDMLRQQGLAAIPPRGPLPISVPGCVDGWAALHRRFGRLPLADVLQPAIRAANDGFPVTEIIAHYWRAGAAALADQPGFAAVFLIDGKAPGPGDRFANPALGRTLQAIAEGGADAFYRGSIAVQLVEFVRRHGGHLAADDLADHRGEWVQPVSTSYRERYRLYELPPNGQGITALQMLNLLEGYDLAEMGFGSSDALHLLVEAKKLAFEDRARFFADPAMADVPVRGLVSKEYAAARRKHIDRGRAATDVSPGDPRLFDGDTVFLATADADGNMVSLIQSNFRGFGSGVTPPELGFGLQDRGELFDLEPGRANSYAPGKRPFHTIIPAFVTRDGEPHLAFGVMGGDMQPQGHVQVLVNLIDHGMTLQEAGDAPRLRHEGSSSPTGEAMAASGGTVLVEPGIAADVLAELARRGHQVVLRAGDGGFGGYQAILRDAARGLWIGASDPRKDGMALGY